MININYSLRTSCSSRDKSLFLLTLLCKGWIWPLYWKLWLTGLHKGHQGLRAFQKVESTDHLFYLISHLHSSPIPRNYTVNQLPWRENPNPTPLLFCTAQSFCPVSLRLLSGRSRTSCIESHDMNIQLVQKGSTYNPCNGRQKPPVNNILSTIFQVD